MPSAKYHREQAQILAGLALTTDDTVKADRYKLAAMEHLEKAEAPENGGIAGSETDNRSP